MSDSSTEQLDDLGMAQAQFRDRLLEAGILLDTGLQGLYGRGAAFEAVIDAIDRAVDAAGDESVAQHKASGKLTDPESFEYTIQRFPPVFPFSDFEKTDYIASFPQLTGAISSFHGGDREHAELLTARAEGHDWHDHLSPSGTMLVSAACHPCYGSLPKELPADGAAIDVRGFCFRHEPAIDPARMQAFRIHEFVRAGTEEQALAHKQEWTQRAPEVLRSLGLEVEPAPANDPFFGRAGRILAVNQRDDDLKTEMVVRIYGDLGEGTAVGSVNYHLEHFGEPFGFHDGQGNIAHTACVGFGLERIALAMFSTHGLDISAWPASIRDQVK